MAIEKYSTGRAEAMTTKPGFPLRHVLNSRVVVRLIILANVFLPKLVSHQRRSKA
jgi:hypothetical protein